MSDLGRAEPIKGEECRTKVSVRGIFSVVSVRRGVQVTYGDQRYIFCWGRPSKSWTFRGP